MNEKEERHEYFENLLNKIGIPEKGRRAYLEYLISQKRSIKFRNQKLDIEVLEEMLEEEE